MSDDRRLPKVVIGTPEQVGLDGLRVRAASVLDDLQYPQEYDSADNEDAIAWVHEALQYMGADICEHGEPDPVGLLIPWAAAMWHVDTDIKVSAQTTTHGYMLTATLPAGTACPSRERVLGDMPDGLQEWIAQARETFGEPKTRADYTVVQLFFYNDSRPLAAVPSLCRNRAEGLLDGAYAQAIEPLLDAYRADTDNGVNS